VIPRRFAGASHDIAAGYDTTKTWIVKKKIWMHANQETLHSEKNNQQQ